MSTSENLQKRKKLLTLSKLELIKKCKALNLKCNGTKSDLVDRLITPKPKKIKSKQLKSKKFSRVKDKEQLIILITGYIRKQMLYDELLSFCVEIICHFALTAINTNFMDIFVTKTRNNHLGRKTNNEYPMFSSIYPANHESLYQFDSNQCINCHETNCLEFVGFYTNDSDNNNNKKMNEFYNNCNEYQCKMCKYYIAHNIKHKYLYYNYSEYGRKKIHYSLQSIIIKPSLAPKQRDNKKYSEKSKLYQCPECKNNMEIIERFWNVSEGHRSRNECERHQDYCNKCQLLRTSITSQSS